MDLNIDKSWTLFLDRDGTINTLRPRDYVKKWEEFTFIDGALDAIPVFNEVFARTVIVTNQQGVGKKIMSEKELRSIHVNMLEEVMLNGGYVDEIYYCPGLATEKPECRKPEIGMAIQALMDFPEVSLEKSIMIGDTLTDMQFGKNAGMKTILLSEEKELSAEYVPFTDYWMADLATFADILVHSHNLGF